ncbi:ankyrin repeat-containing domain protein [Mycena leptocephala]|nr:ankyrin repeat-containing domain protein [Mycena leptocephala]
MNLLDDGGQQYKKLSSLFVSIWGQDMGSPLYLCCSEGYIEGVQHLLANRADVNFLGPLGSPLMVALLCGHLEIGCLLLKSGADVNLEGGRYGSALTVASYVGKLETVRFLLDRGADVNLKGGNMAVHWQPPPVVASWRPGEYGSALAAAAASYSGKLETVRLLLDRGADVNLKGGKYGSALAAVSYWGHLEIVRLLLDRGADVNLKGGEYGSALAAASSCGKLETIHLRGADVNLQGGYVAGGRLALQYATQQHYSQIEALLREKGAQSPEKK